MSEFLVLTLKSSPDRDYSKLSCFEESAPGDMNLNPVSKSSTMYLKIKSPNFIDRLSFEIDQVQKSLLRAVLKDDTGFVCSELQKEVTLGRQSLDWEGLNELPYGVYTLEVSQGADEMKLRLVKRI